MTGLKLSMLLAVGVFVVCLHPSCSYKVLMIPALLKSHYQCFFRLAIELTNRGHHVSMVANDLFKPPPTMHDSRLTTINYEVCAEPGCYTDLEDINKLVVDKTFETKGDLSSLYSNLSSIIQIECRQILMNNEAFLRKLEDEKFDLVVMDGFFMVKCMYLIPHRLGTPVVSLIDIILPWELRLPWLPSAVPVPFVPLTEKMSFMQRVKNTLVSAYIAFLGIMPGPEADIMDKYQTYGSVRKVEELMESSQLWLYTSDVVLEYPQPLMPHVVEVGGIGTSPSAAIDKDVKTYVDESTAGVVVVSFGSIAADFPKDVGEKLMDAFGKLSPIRVIWRFHNSAKHTVPANVKLMSWLPQNDLLAQNKTLAFVTHCGKNGLFEAVYHGVPIVGVPLFGDQGYNAALAKYKGYGLTIDPFDFTPDVLVQTIKQVIETPSYKESMVRASRIFHSRPERPVERAAHWVEHVMKYGGDHLRSGAYDLNFVQYWMLDVIAVLALIITLLLTCVYKTVKLAYRRLCGRGKKIKQKTQ